MSPGNGEVGEMTVLKDYKNSEDALKLLQSLHQQCIPIMRKHGWGIPCLGEFFPAQTNLLGLNINGGEKILIRLRPARRPNSFYDREMLLGTLLHELTHNVRSPHDKVFYDQLDKLQDELDELLKAGYTGEGFFGKGVRVGQGVSHDTGRTMAEARKIALDTLEKKIQIQRLLGKGGKLGGRVLDMKGKRMADILAEAAERRIKDAKSCGSSDAHPAGCPRDQLPPETLAEVEKAERDSRSVVVDLTRDEDDEDAGGEYYVAVKDEEEQPKPDIKGKGNGKDPPRERRVVGPPSKPRMQDEDQTQDSDSSVEIMSGPPVPRTKRPPSPAPIYNRTSSNSSSTSASTSKSKAKANASPPKKLKSATAPTRHTSTSTSAKKGWACPTCTYENDSPLSLSCEACYTERPSVAGQSLLNAASGRPRDSRSVTIELDEGWLCHRCTALTEHKFWACRVCQAIKQSSTMG